MKNLYVVCGVNATRDALRELPGVRDRTLRRVRHAEHAVLPERVTVLGMPPAGPGGGWRDVTLDARDRVVALPVGIASSAASWWVA